MDIQIVEPVHLPETEAPAPLPRPGMPVNEHWLTQFAEKHVPGFRGGIIRRTAAAMLSPWSTPIKWFCLDLADFAVRLGPTLQSVPKTILEESQRQRDSWVAWSPAEQRSVLRQFGVWLVTLCALLWLALVLPLPFKIIPLATLVAGWYSRRHWDLARWTLGLEQLESHRVTDDIQDAEVVEQEIPKMPMEIGEHVEVTVEIAQKEYAQ